MDVNVHVLKLFLGKSFKAAEAVQRIRNRFV